MHRTTIDLLACPNGFAFLGGERAVREDAVAWLAPHGRVIEVSIGTGGNVS